VAARHDWPSRRRAENSNPLARIRVTVGAYIIDRFLVAFI